MTVPAIDPVVHIGVRLALALLFVWAAVHKLRNLDSFKRAVGGYRLLPEALAPPVALLLPAAELIAAASLLLFSGWRGMAPAGALLSIYGGAMAINLLRGNDSIDCGCAGPARTRRVSAGLVIRNAALLLAATVTALPVSPRPLGWLDFTTIPASIVFAALIYATAEGLGDNALRLRHLRRRHAEPALQLSVGE
jgi:hypothetical protein